MSVSIFGNGFQDHPEKLHPKAGGNISFHRLVQTLP